MPPGAPQGRLSAWWLDRMLKTRHPLREKMTLFWHNHFATSNAKVQNARFMLGQYRADAAARARQLRASCSRRWRTDPAMLVWLDTHTSTKGKPERELRPRTDGTLLARHRQLHRDGHPRGREAFTGYEIKDGKGAFNRRQHDAGEKTVFGKTGKFKGEDIVSICLEQPACPRFIVAQAVPLPGQRHATPPTAELIEPLAEQYRKCDFDTGKLVATILRSNLFFSPHAYRREDQVAGRVRARHRARRSKARPARCRWRGRSKAWGRVLFAPPSVKGWDGGPAWLNAQTLLGRNNLALALTSTEDAAFGRALRPGGCSRKHGAKTRRGAGRFPAAICSCKATCPTRPARSCSTT